MSTCNFTLQTDISSINYCASGVFYVSLDLFRSMFLFSTPYIINNKLYSFVLDNPIIDIKYLVLSDLYPDINSAHAMMGNSLSEGIMYADLSANQLIKHDFIFYLVKQKFNRFDFYWAINNKKELASNLEEIGWTHKNNIKQVLTTAFNSGLGMTNTITDASNLTRILLKQIVHFDVNRLNVSMDFCPCCWYTMSNCSCKDVSMNDIYSGIRNIATFQSVPLIEGDTISYFLNIDVSGNEISARKYKIILYLTNDATKLNSNIHPTDSVTNDNEYQGNITNDGVP
jgi:hypothetical protein